MSMLLLDRINHCTPNKSAYWCSTCECHSQFEITDSQSTNSSGTRTSTENYRCHQCGRRMFCPRVVARWPNGLLGIAFSAVVLVPLMDLQFDVRVDGLIPCSIGLGVFFGALGFWMGLELRKWKAWRFQQEMKTPSELAREAEAHPHQPVYRDSETDFNAWAEQFMSRENLRELHAEHGYEWTGKDEATTVKSHWYYDPDLKYLYVTLYVCLVAAVLSFALVKWQQGSHDAGQHEDHAPHQQEDH